MRNVRLEKQVDKLGGPPRLCVYESDGDREFVWFVPGVCTYCETPIEDDDDPVISCGHAYHQECWDTGDVAD